MEVQISVFYILRGVEGGLPITKTVVSLRGPIDKAKKSAKKLIKLGRNSQKGGGGSAIWKKLPKEIKSREGLQRPSC